MTSQTQLQTGTTSRSSKKHLRYILVSVIISILLLVLIVLNISIGSVAIPVEDILALFGGAELDETRSSILWKIRVPRMVAGIVLGGALALAGFLLQTFFNNPIAGPFVLGISSGAKMVVALLMVFSLGHNIIVGSGLMVAAAFVGAMIAMGFVLFMAKHVQRASTLILSGVMIGYICSAITDFIITFADDASIVNLHNWSQGSFSGINWSDVQVMCVVVLVASVIVFLLAKPIGAYQMGESYAQSMGVNIKILRAAMVLLSSLLAACVTAFAGPVSFVGIAVPHLVRSFLKTSKPLIVIPVCFLGGAIFCLGCDLVARTVFAPTELSISAVTAIFGAPIVIAILLGRKAK